MLFKGIISALFPNTCASCGTIIDEEEFFCDYCMCMLEQSAKDKLCVKCALPKKQCQCKYITFSFDGVVAPFYRETSAKNAMYEFKYRKNLKISRFFAERMALAVKQYYGDIDFDFLCPVPMSKFAEKRRGFNQSALLGQDLAKILDIPFYKDIIYSKHKKRSQYKLNAKQRKENVKNIYFTTKKLKGQTVLLVDDIKTTGSTLNECAKVLLTAGADKVYCITGLISKLKDKEKITNLRKEGTHGNRNRNRFRNF